MTKLKGPDASDTLFELNIAAHFRLKGIRTLIGKRGIVSRAARRLCRYLVLCLAVLSVAGGKWKLHRATTAH
jgi:hypothetical protein